ncbi:MAG: DUF3726 domain-containing protein [Pseudomonadota bacterium]
MTAPGGDQTRGESTAFFEERQTAVLSRNEIAALCLKAARGAGMAWGLAEEAGFAAAWLAGQGLDGPGHLLTHLNAASGRTWADLCPVVTPGEWRAPPGGAICPIALGATLCDHTALPAGPVIGGPLRIGPVDHPILLLPFLATVAARQAVDVVLSWEDGAMKIHAKGIGTTEALHGRTALPLRLQTTDLTDPGPGASARPEIANDTVLALSALALRTTVPTSATSRAGAGAGKDD